MLRRAALLCSLLLVIAVPMWGQATLDAQNSVTDVLTSAAPTTTLAHTTGTGANRLLLVAIHLNVIPSVGTTISTATYNGQPLTLLNAITDASTDTRTEVWYMLNPPSGNHNVVTTAGGITPGQNVEAVVSATTFSNVDQVVPVSAADEGANDPATVIVPATATSDLVLSFVSVRETVTLTADAPSVAGYNVSTGGTNNDLQAAVSGRAAVTPNTTVSWDLSANRNWSIVGVNVKQATADVQITKYATSDPVIPGGTLTYTILVQNNGPSSATGVSVSDPIPGATTFISSNTSQGSCSGTSTVTCNIGTLADGGTATITIQVQAPLAGGFIGNNTATVSSTSIDPGTPNTSTANAFSLVQATVCGTQPGKDGTGSNITGVINSYWPGTSASVAAGATGFNVGTRRGAAVNITAGDLLLIMQMQDAAIDSNNDSRYGDGNGIAGNVTGIGAGFTTANSVGRYEYAIATNTIGAAGGALTFTAVGGGNGLMYAYTNAAAGAQGQRRYQVVRVPQYTTVTLGAALTASSWNGTTGGILAFDVAGDLALNSQTANVNGLGFRGGAGLAYAGGAGANTDYRTTVGNTHNGFKGEGIAGTPEWVYDSGANLDTGPQGYPNGDMGRGAPGNGGGGGTDGNVGGNDENSGGGGGGGWGRGGGGGNTWQSNLARGGFGGAPYYASPGKVVLGGGGGAGSRNNSADPAGAGATGGGIILVRAGRITGTGTMTANGTNAYDTTDNDGGGGGGAGGSIVVLTRGGGLGGLTLRANGGDGGNAWSTQAPGGFPGERHGPGGGGGGGYIATNGTLAASSVNGGTSGITTTANDTFGAQPGAPGAIVLSASFDEITGVKSGCTDLTVSINDSPDPVIAGQNITYTIAVTNNSTNVPAQNPSITMTTAPGTTFVSMTPPPGWSCTTPSVGGTGAITCSSTTPLAVSTTTPNFTLVLATPPSTANGATITQQVTTATTSPETNTGNNTDTENTAVIRRVDVAITKVTNDAGTDNAFEQGQTLIYTLVVTNNGPSRATNVVMTDPLPAGFSFVSVVPGGPTCTHSSGTVTCTYAVMDPGATNNIVITGTITVNTAQLVNTATTTRTETDTNPANNSATAIVSVLAPTAITMFEANLEQDGDGNVRIAWNTSFEVDNLGFNIYRETKKGRERVNDHLIPGSALFAANRRLASGSGYAWADRVGRGEFAQYSIEDVDLNGTRTLHGPFTPVLTAGDSLRARITSDAEARIASEAVSGGGIFVSPRGLGAPTYPVPKGTANKLAKQQIDIVSQPGVKLMVAQEGWYRVAKSDLANAGFFAGANVSLFTGGAEQPIVATADAIEFYGVGLDAPGSGARAYFLTNNSGKGERVALPGKARGGRTTAARTSYTFERIERTVFFAALTNNGDRENFFGALVTSQPVSRELTIENLDATGGAASLDLVLQGVGEAGHAVRLSFNGNVVGTISFSGTQRRVAKVNVPAHLLLNGANTLTMTALQGDTDLSVVESMRITYPHLLVADDNALKVLVGGGSSVAVDGFTANSVRAIDITDVQPIELPVDYANGTASFMATSAGSRSILVFGDTRVLAPAQIVPVQPSRWSDRANLADMVVIASSQFIEAAQPLKERRDDEGVLTTIIDVQELYNEFAFGEHGPQAIREFLYKAREWKRAPKYVLLLGDASIDPRNYLNLGAYDFVPTKLLPTSYLKTASDDWFADFANSGVPQIAIGRLPARTTDDAETMIARIANRNTSGNESVSFVSSPTDGFDFGAAAQSLASVIPSSTPRSFASSATPASFDSLVMTYVGHGSVDLWSAGNFSGAAALQLTNSKQPIVTALTCLSGYFHDVYTTSLAESLIGNPTGGAVAVWASSTLTGPVAQIDAATELYRRLFGGSTLGSAVLGAKSKVNDADLRKSWILFGDPSMKLR